MGFNSDLSDALSQMAQLLELTGASGFRVNAHRRAARSIKDHTADLREIAHDNAKLTSIPGVGKGIAGKVGEFADTGDIAERKELLGSVPHGLLAVLDIPGLGPKTVKQLWDELEVTSVDDLKALLDSGKIEELKGLGKKTVQNIRDAIDLAARQGGRAQLGPAAEIAERVVEFVRALPGVTRAEYAGSLRRGKETIGDVDVLAAAGESDAEAVMAAFVGMDGVEKTLAHGATKSSVVLTAPGHRSKDVPLQVDLRVVREGAFGAALMYFTGSKEHNVRLRERAQKKGLTLNEYGLFEDDGEPAPQKRGAEPVASETEEAIYAALDAPYLPPTLREDRGELDIAETPRLIEVGDIRAELHAHTTASDGKLSIHELAEEARSRGLEVIAVTDHSQSAAIAGGLSPERLLEHIDAVRAANEEIEGIDVLAGSEVDILADGSLDYEDELLEKLDVVVASPHIALQQKKAKAMPRLLRAIEHPLVRIVGHPTGRMLNRRDGLEIDIAELAAAAKEHDTALEINAHFARLDLRDVHVSAALDAGALIAINTDAHTREHFGNLRFGVLTGQRGGLTPASCVNTWDAARLSGWLRREAPANA